MGCMGANITDHSVERVGRCLRRLQLILQQYDKENNINEVSGSHSKRSATIDLNKTKAAYKISSV